MKRLSRGETVTALRSLYGKEWIHFLGSTEVGVDDVQTVIVDALNAQEDLTGHTVENEMMKLHMAHVHSLNLSNDLKNKCKNNIEI